MSKRKYAYLSFVLFSLMSLAAIMVSYAWVNSTKKAKIEYNEVNIEGAGELLISLNGGTSYYPTIDALDDAKSSYASLLQIMTLKDYTGDGINLYSPVVDPYTKKPISGGWQVIRTVADSYFDNGAIEMLNDKNENKNYYSFEVYFRSNVYMDVYLSRNSYVLPSTDQMANGEVLLLKRVATYVVESGITTYDYYTENGHIGTNLLDSQLPRVYNRSLYCFNFNNELDEAVFANEENAVNGVITNTQSIFSANYISSAVRVAFIDEEKNGAYDTVVIGEDGHGDFEDSKLRMIWAPNPLCQSDVKYNNNTNSWSYNFDIASEERTKVVGGKTYSLDNGYYLVNHQTLVQSDLKTFPNDIFVSNLDDGIDTVSSYENHLANNEAYDYKPHKLVTLSDEDGDGIYSGKVRIIMWIEGTDIEANASLTGGSLSSSSNLDEGSAKIKFLLSFFGYQKKEPSI